MSDTAEAKYKYDKNSPKLSRAPQGRRLGDEHLEVYGWTARINPAQVR